MQCCVRLTKITMHTRIKDFALDAIVKNIAVNAWVFTDAELDAFATLIVQECANVAEKISGKMEPEMVADMLRMHFGVDT